ncbi:hypothetical protein [Streptomyces sp. NPDC002779]|uniref:hypothetical protein n=1 Tax=Streptomyces sp. NPDC002779 TaxID=3364664 RepID=UPI0036B0290F
MNLENPGGVAVRRADASDWTGLAVTDPIAAGGDARRREGIRRWCEQGVVLLAEDGSGAVGYSVLEYTFFEQGCLTMLDPGRSAPRPGRR